MKKVANKLSVVATEILECKLDKDNKQVAVVVADYIAKKLSKRSKCSECQLKLVANESGIEYDNYLQELYCGGLTTPSHSLRDFIFKTFSIINFISPTIKIITKNVCVRKVSKRVLLNLGYSTNFTCDLHKE